MSENNELEEEILDMPEEEVLDIPDEGDYYGGDNEIEPIEQDYNNQSNSGQSIVGRTRENNNQNTHNNSNNIKNSKEIASRSGNPYNNHNSRILNRPNRFSSFRPNEKTGKQLNIPKKNLMNVRNEQSKLNRVSENGIGDKVDSFFGRRKLNNTYQKKSSTKTVDGSTSKKGSVFAAKRLVFKIMLIFVLSFVIIILLAAVAVSGGEDGKKKSENSSTKNSYLYGSGTKDQLHEYLIEQGYCEDVETCESSDAAAFYTKLKEKISTNRNFKTMEIEAFITECIFYGRDSDVMFSTIDEIEYIASIIKTDKAFTLEDVDNYIDFFISDDGYLVTYRSDLVGENSTEEERKQIFYDMLESVNLAYEMMDKETPTSSHNYVCTQVTVVGENAGTYSLDEYVAMVITAENDWSINGNLENNKAHAVAVRTKVIRDTDDCTLSIDNTKGKIKMAATASQTAIDATNAVAGQILVDEENDYISVSYDEFCLKNSDDNNYYLAQKNIAIPKTWANENGVSSIYLNEICLKNDKPGMSIWGTRYLSTQGKTYEQILSTFYENSKIITIGKQSGGIEIASSGFAKRVSRALRDNPYIYGGLGYEGECAWYAVGRTNEILAGIGSNKKVYTGGNGNGFCYASDYASFPKVYDVNEFKPGMVISWNSFEPDATHNFGHVAIIEDVYYDSNGNVESVDISEASISSGTGMGTTFSYPGYPNVFIANNHALWNIQNDYHKTLARQFICEGSMDGSTGNGCQTFTNVPANKIKNRWKGFSFICAMDLSG